MAEKLLDLEGLLKRTMDDKDITKEILLCYIEESSTMINTLNNFIKLQDYKKIEEYAHELKGSSISVGAILITEISIRIQNAAKNKDIATVSRTMKDLNKAHNKTLKTINSSEVMI